MYPIGAIIIAILVAVLLILVIDWLGPKVEIPGQILMILKAIVVVILILKLLGMIGVF